MRRLFLIPTLCFIWLSGYAQDKTMSLVSYNVLHGFENDSLKEREFVKWVIEKDVDVLALQELNGFDQDRLSALAAKYGHPYVEINVGVTHPLGITSKYPIVMPQHVINNMWHSYLYGNINGIHVFVTHLSPFEVKLRNRDVNAILAHAKLLPDNEYKVILGDFNAFAASDSSAYNEEFLASMRAIEGRLEPKSGLPIVKGKTIYRNNLDHGRIDYSVTQKMISSGFDDSFWLLNKTFKHSVPTLEFQKEKSNLIRIDYIWTNKIMSSSIEEADIIQDKVTKKLSDHYPVYLKVKLNSQKN